MINTHRQWMYKGGVSTGRIFEVGENVPDGWSDVPGEDVKEIPVRTKLVSRASSVESEKIDEPKTPKHMTKSELVAFSHDLELNFDMSMSRGDMIRAVYAKMKGDNHEDSSQD